MDDGNINLHVPENYYDLQRDRIFVRGFKYSDSVVGAKFITYPGVLQNIYCISEKGKIYSAMDDTYMEWGIRCNLPFVNLISSRKEGITLEPYFIKDLMAYSYIAGADSYLERGFRAVNIDGDPMNCDYSNIIFLKS